jgi:hypothetical protein
VQTEHQRVRSVATVLPKDASFMESCHVALTATPGVRQTTV